ncbi:MAG: triphosphoribosyl-dephospho-CoA synthase [Methylotenera sp.]
MNSQQIANAFKVACLAELEALKPGNVHIFADGHGMTVQDFIASAEAASAVIAKPELSLGQRILQSVQATHVVVNCNTNLGMILLCAPIIQAIIHAKLNANSTGLQANIHAVLSGTTIEDAEACFAAIRLANPAGLGESAQHDVQQKADCTLLQAMQKAASHDMIACQYANNFMHIFDGLAVYQKALVKWQRPAWAATAVHLHYLSHFLDSHIVRKYGETIANLVQNEAREHEMEFSKVFNPKNYQAELLIFDAALKKRGLNPGTSADLTVATLLLHALL